MKFFGMKESITCGSCNRQIAYKGKDAPMQKAMMGEYAMYCQSCGTYVCIPCVAVAMNPQNIIDATANVMTGKGKCPCCGTLSVNFER